MLVGNDLLGLCITPHLLSTMVKPEVFRIAADSYPTVLHYTISDALSFRAAGCTFYVFLVVGLCIFQ